MGKSNSNATNILSRSQARASTLSNLAIHHFPQSITIINSAASPSSPAEDEVFYDALEDLDIFYDALDYFYDEVKPQPLDSTTVSQTQIDVEAEGAAKGSRGAFAAAGLTFPLSPNSFPHTTAPVTSPPTTPANRAEFTRGSSKPTASPSLLGHFPTYLTAQSAAASVPVPRTPKKKALLIGLNYERCGKNDLRLRHATQDARRFATTLTKLGYSSEDMKVVVDDDGSFPSAEYLVEAMDWLVQDILPGDRLFFMFSGHCDAPAPGKPEAQIVAADLMTIPRSTFQERLVGKVLAGAELTIVLDCCNAAGMVKLKYCVGKMEYKPEMKQIARPGPVSELGRPPVPLGSNFPQRGSLHGMKNVDYQAPAPLSNRAPDMSNSALFGTPVNTPSHTQRGIFAARLPSSSVAPITAQAPGKETTVSPPAFAGSQPGPVQRRQLVVDGRPLPHFEKPQDSFVAPAGKIVVWAGTGERQKAFESSTGADNGIVTDAICSILEKPLDIKGTITLRDVWQSLVSAIERENELRRERDAQKAKRPAPNLRVQCAQLLVSQQETLSSFSPIFNQTVC